jgi:hypothetical protein
MTSFPRSAASKGFDAADCNHSLAYRRPEPDSQHRNEVSSTMSECEIRCNTARVLQVEAEDEKAALPIAAQTDFSGWDSADSTFEIEPIGSPPASGTDVGDPHEVNMRQVVRWLLYDLAMDALLGTKVYSEYAEAVEDAAQANDIRVVPLVIPGKVM